MTCVCSLDGKGPPCEEWGHCQIEGACTACKVEHTREGDKPWPYPALDTQENT